jgi:hypothetical protein
VERRTGWNATARSGWEEASIVHVLDTCGIGCPVRSPERRRGVLGS